MGASRGLKSVCSLEHVLFEVQLESWGSKGEKSRLACWRNIAMPRGLSDAQPRPPDI